MLKHLSICIGHLRTNIRCRKSPFPSDLMKSSSCLDESLSTIPTGVLLQESADYYRYHVILISLLLRSHDQKSHVSPQFDQLIVQHFHQFDLLNAVVSLTTPSASYDSDAFASCVTCLKKSCFTSLIISTSALRLLW